MKKVLIIGASSGIGAALTKKLANNNYLVWGVARRGSLLREIKAKLEKKSNFIYTQTDISTKSAWDNFLMMMRRKKFRPDVVVFNAAILENDLSEGLDIKITEKVMETNFFSVMRGVGALLPYIEKNAQLIAISSSSAFKGSAHEGVGYSASKAALSVAFETFYQRYLPESTVFTTIYFGPIQGGMRQLKRNPPLTLSVDKAVNCVIKAINGRRNFYYCPKVSFVILQIVKAVLPNEVTLKLFSKVNRIYK